MYSEQIINKSQELHKRAREKISQISHFNQIRKDFHENVTRDAPKKLLTKLLGYAIIYSGSGNPDTIIKFYALQKQKFSASGQFWQRIFVFSIFYYSDKNVLTVLNLYLNKL